MFKGMVLDRRTNENPSLECGDFVRCLNCGRTMFVNVGTTICPECDEDILIWKDENNQEVSDSFFINNEDYILTDTEE